MNFKTLLFLILLVSANAIAKDNIKQQCIESYFSRGGEERCIKAVATNPKITVGQVKYCSDLGYRNDAICLKHINTISLSKINQCIVSFVGMNEPICIDIVGKNPKITVEQIIACDNIMGFGNVPTCLKHINTISLNQIKQCVDSFTGAALESRCINIIAKNNPNIMPKQIKKCADDNYGYYALKCLGALDELSSNLSSDLSGNNVVVIPKEDFKEIPKAKVPATNSNKHINHSHHENVTNIKVPENTKDSLIEVSVGGSSLSLNSTFDRENMQLIKNVMETTLSYTNRIIKLYVNISCISSTDFFSPNSEPYANIAYSTQGQPINNEIEKGAIIELPINHSGSISFDIYEDDLIFNDSIGFCIINQSDLSNVLRGKSSAKCTVGTNVRDICSVTITKI